MPRTCTICTHAEREAINQALVASEPYRHIAARFGTSTGALQRHKADCLPSVMVKSEQAKQVAHADDLLVQVKQLRNKAISILLKAEAGGDYRTALMGIREARGCLELLAEMEGELNRNPVVNILVAPEWLSVRTVMLRALQPFPEARTAVAAALIGVNVATAELGQDLAMALDPVLLMDQAGVVPDPWQARVLRSRSSRVLLNCCRQSGKSTTTAGLALHTAIYEPESLILLLSPGERQSKELLRKVLAIYRALERPVPAESENTLTLELENGSRIVALPGTEGTIRGYSGVRLLIVDEASRVPDLLYQAVRPMLAVSGGRLLALSTPWGRRSWWFEAWENGGIGWERVKVTAHECSRISAEFLQEERDTLPDLFFQSEYMCRFVDTEDQYFATEDIEAMLTDDFAPLFPIHQEAAWIG